MGFRAVIIGAGLGGLGCGALLAQAGHDVTILESHPFAGGRCTSFEQDGFLCDFGVHMFSRGESGPLGRLARQLGQDLQWVTHTPPCRVMGRVEFDFPLDINPLAVQVMLARKLRIHPANLWGARRLFNKLLAAKAPDEWDGESLHDFTLRFTRDPMVHLFMNCVAQLYFALSYKEASAGEFMWCFSRMFKEASFGYPRGGAGGIVKAFERGFVRHGGRLLLKEDVQNIVVEKGRAVGVKTASGLFPADVVISNAGMGATVRLTGEKHFEPDYVKRSQSLKYSNPFITIKYALSRRVIPHPVVFHMPHGDPSAIFDYVDNHTAPRDPFLFVPVPSNHDPSLAPPGCQLVIAGAPAPRGADDGLCNAIADSMDLTMRRLFPNLTPALLWQKRTTRGDVTALTGHAPGGAIGLGQFPGQTGGRRPGYETGIPGLYLTGADAGARGIGTELAAGSGMGLAGLFLKGQERAA